MSKPVALEQLRSEIQRLAFAPYLLTVGDDGRPHAVAVVGAWEGDALAFEVGKRSASNAAARPQVSLLWPPNEPGGYSLIVDGEASPDAARVLVRPTRAVLHRPAATPEAAGPSCAADCIPIR